MRRIRRRLLQFLFPPASDRWLSILRWGLGLQVLAYCLTTRMDWLLLFATNSSSLINRDLSEALLSSDSACVPRLGWLIMVGEHLGLPEVVTLNLSWWLLFAAGVSLLLGFFCRSSALLAWFLHLCAVKSGTLSSYGMDNFTTIGLFYLIIAPLPDRYSIDARIRNLPSKDRRMHGFFRRVLQLHLCISYFFGGLTKALGPAWWTGESLWRALTRVPFNNIPPELLASWGTVLPVLGIAVCLLETAYPIFIWPAKTRVIWLTAVVVMHMAIALTMGLYLFGMIMIVLNVSAFGTDLTREGARVGYNYARRRNHELGS